MGWIGVITTSGKNVLAKWVDGKTLSIDAARTGTGTVPEVSLTSQTDLVNRIQDMSATSSTITDAGRKIKLQIGPAEASYVMNQIGVWGSVDGDPELLMLYQNTDGVNVYSEEESPDYKYVFYATLVTDNSGNLTLNIDTSTGVTYEEYHEKVEEIEGHLADIRGKISVTDLGSMEGETSDGLQDNLKAWLSDLDGSTATSTCSFEAGEEWIELWNELDTSTSLTAGGKYTVRAEHVDADSETGEITSAKLTIWTSDGDAPDYGIYSVSLENGTWKEVRSIADMEPVKALYGMLYNNRFFAPVLDENGNPILDESGNAIMADWKYKVI